jgi:hypothetical protein
MNTRVEVERTRPKLEAWGGGGKAKHTRHTSHTTLSPVAGAGGGLADPQAYHVGAALLQLVKGL